MPLTSSFTSNSVMLGTEAMRISLILMVASVFANAPAHSDEGEFEDLKSEVDFACSMTGVSNARIEVAFQVSRKAHARAQESGTLMRELVLGKDPAKAPRVDTKKLVADRLRALEFDVDVEVSKLNALQLQKVDLERKARAAREAELKARKEKGEAIDVAAELQKPLEPNEAQKRNKLEIEKQRARLKLATTRHRESVDRRAELEARAATDTESARAEWIRSYRTNKKETLTRLQREHDAYTSLAARAGRCYNEAAGRTEAADAVPPAASPPAAVPAPPVQVTVPGLGTSDLSAPAAQ